MRTMQQAREDKMLADAAPGGAAELASLRNELRRYRGIFDSARLIVGHELAKPITAANGYLELLEDYRGDAVDDRERGYISKIRIALAHLAELVESVVEMLRVEYEKDDLCSHERVDIRMLAEAVRGRFESDAHSIAVSIPADFPPLRAPRRCIEIVLENLVSNAVKHGGGQPVNIAAELSNDTRDLRGGEILILTVSDRGAGIPGDKLDDIFAPFFRIDSGDGSAGLGLGLALVKSVVTHVRGEIHVRSKQGDGTTVTVAVPVARAGSLVSDTVG